MDMFKKSLTKTDMEQKLAVPTDFVTRNGLADGPTELEVTDKSTGFMFEKSLTSTDIYTRLAVPTDFVTRNGLADGPTELEFTDKSTGRSYQFKLLIRRTGLHMKPVFESKGWLQFVRDNNLKVGDTIHLWKEDNGRFGISVTKDYLSRCVPFKY